MNGCTLTWRCSRKFEVCGQLDVRGIDIELCMVALEQ